MKWLIVSMLESGISWDYVFANTVEEAKARIEETYGDDYEEHLDSFTVKELGNLYSNFSNITREESEEMLREVSEGSEDEEYEDEEYEDDEYSDA